MGSQIFQTISALYKTWKPTFLVELENGHYVWGFCIFPMQEMWIEKLMVPSETAPQELYNDVYCLMNFVCPISSSLISSMTHPRLLYLCLSFQSHSL
jgi:hypothetical protein